MKLKDKVAIVTGAGRNIGEEVAKLFAAEGAKVAVVDLDRPRGERTAAAINVAISDNKSILDITEEEWDRVIAVTLKSQFLMSKHVAQQMVAQGQGGRIVNVGSTSGWQG